MDNRVDRDRAQTDTGGIFSYRQVARFEEIELAGALIAFETTGRLDIPASGNDGREEETSMEASGTILLDLVTGRIVESGTSGTITSQFGVAGFTIIRGIEASYDTSLIRCCMKLLQTMVLVCSTPLQP